MGRNNNRGPYLPNLEPFIAAGINPQTGLPVKFGGSTVTLVDEIRKNLRVVDRANAVNRFKWENLPCNITSQELERLLYLKGQLCFFYDSNLEQFYFMPYALDGTIDFYGRYNTIHPVPMTSGMDDKGNKAQAQYLAEKKLKVIYDIKDLKPEDDINNVCIILRDYTNHLSQTILPRATLDEPILEVMAECPAFMRTSLLLSTGVKGVRVQDADQAAAVADASRSMARGALTGNPFIPIIGNVEFQELNEGNIGKAEEFMLAYQSLDNMRLSFMGIDNTGVYEKKAHLLQEEAEVNGGPIGLVMQDGEEIRKHFAELGNKIWSLQMQCNKNEIDPYDESAIKEESDVEVEEESTEGEPENE